MHSLPVFVRLAGRAVILVGEGEAADAKRRLLDRAGAVVVGEESIAALAIVAINDPEETVARLRARGVLVNAVDRSDLCDFTLPAIVDRDPVIVAIGTGGASAGLAAALRQRLEAVLPVGLGAMARQLAAARGALRARYPDMGDRRRAIAAMLAAGGPLDLLAAAAGATIDLDAAERGDETIALRLSSTDPDELTLRQARLLANADRVYHADDVPPAILDRARADAARIAGAPPVGVQEAGLTIVVGMA